MHPTFRTPHVAITLHAAACCLLALTGTFRSLVVLSVVSTLLVYLACCLPTLRLRARDVRSDGAPFCIPGGPAVPLAAIGVVLWLLMSASHAECLTNGAVVVVASALYLFRRRVPVPAPQPVGGP